MDIAEFLKKEYNLNSLPNKNYKQYFTFTELIELLEKYKQVLNLPKVGVTLVCECRPTGNLETITLTTCSKCNKEVKTFRAN